MPITIDIVENPITIDVVQSGPNRLDLLSDVAITTPADGQVIEYNSTTEKRENKTPAGGAVTSVFGRTDDVVAQTGDYTADQITETATKVFVTPTEKDEIADSFKKSTDTTDNITDTAINRFTNDTEITRLANTSGTNTGDQDLTNYLDKTIDKYLVNVIAGTNITIDYADPKNPIISSTGGGGTPGGTDGNIQFNDGGVFGGATNLNRNPSTKSLEFLSSANYLVPASPFSSIVYNGSFLKIGSEGNLNNGIIVQRGDAAFGFALWQERSGYSYIDSVRNSSSAGWKIRTGGSNEAMVIMGDSQFVKIGSGPALSRLHIDGGYGSTSGLALGNGDSGLYESSDDIIVGQVGGVKFMTVAPDLFLHETSSTGFKFATTPTATSGYVKIYAKSDSTLYMLSSGGTEKVLLNSVDGQTISGTQLYTGVVNFSSVTNSSGFRMQSSTANVHTILGYYGSAYNDLDIRCTPGVGSHLYLKTDGKVGVGTIPTSKLHIDGGYGPTSGLAFGNGDTGLYESVDDILNTLVGGVVSEQVTTTQMSIIAPATTSTPHKNGAISFDLDETGNNLNFRVLYSDGTAKTGTVALV